MLTRLLPLTLLLAGLCVPAGRAAAQSLEVDGPVAGPAAEALREIAGRGRFLVLSRDTVLPASFRAPGDLVVARGAVVRLEGEVAGSVAVLGGELFVRPGARIGGPVVVVNGGYYPSGLASAGEALELDPRVRATIGGSPREIVVRLAPPPRPGPLAAEGIFGLGLPTYDRVNGLTLRAGATLYPGLDREGARVTATALVHTHGPALGGKLAAAAPLRESFWAVAEAARRTATNEEWIRGALTNSLASIALGSDARNYYRTDEVSVGIERRLPQPLVAGESWIGPRLLVRASRDRSLAAADPWSVLGSLDRPNPPVAEGTLVSAVAGAAASWRGVAARFDGDLALEWAPGAAGDFEFAQLVADGRWSMLALWGHTIEVYGHLLQPLGSNAAPPQRWSFVGGTSTLPTLPLGALRGDHVVFLESTYLAPVPRVRLPLLGSPSLQLIHATGTAWVTGDPLPRWEQNLGAGVVLSLLEAMAYVNPAAATLQPDLSLAVRLPF